MLKKISKKALYPSIIGIIALAVVVGVYPYAADQSENNTAPNSQQDARKKDNQRHDKVAQLMSGGSPVMGDNDAPITIIEYGDYQCTYCYRFHQNTRDKLLDDYVDTGKARFVFQDFPLNGADSVLAAQASYCAQDQSKYWQYHNELYNNWAGERTGWINKESLVDFASNVDLETGKFKECLQSKKYKDRVLQNERTATDIGIRATPSFLIFGSSSDSQGMLIKGSQPYEVFQRVLDKAS